MREGLAAARIILLLGLLAIPTSGCVELQALLGGTPANQGGGSGGSGGSAGSGGGDSTPDTGGEGLATVVLRVSNATPELDESVTLTCTVESGSTDGLSFDFTSTLGRLDVDRQRGVAGFIVEQSDLGVAFSFSCSATNRFGTGPRSPSVVVIPTLPTTAPAP